MYEWLLFLHVLAAFAVVAGLTAFGVLVYDGRGTVRSALFTPARALWNGGAVGVLVFGVWLALDVDEYALWDAWIIAALALWLVAGGVSGRLERGLREGDDSVDARLLFWIMTAATALLLIDMIFKPGA